MSSYLTVYLHNKENKHKDIELFYLATTPARELYNILSYTYTDAYENADFKLELTKNNYDDIIDFYNDKISTYEKYNNEIIIKIKEKSELLLKAEQKVVYEMISDEINDLKDEKEYYEDEIVYYKNLKSQFNFAYEIICSFENEDKYNLYYSLD